MSTSIVSTIFFQQFEFFRFAEYCTLSYQTPPLHRLALPGHGIGNSP